MKTGKPDLLGPALVGGLAGAALSLLPPFCCLNCVCCLNYVLGGLIAGALYARSAAKWAWLPQAGEGASTGALAGFVAGLAHGLVGSLLLLFWLLTGAEFGRGARLHGPVPIATWEWEFGAPSTASILALVAGHLFVHIVLGAAAGIVGGMLGVVLFRREPATAGPAAGAGVARPTTPPEAAGPA